MSQLKALKLDAEKLQAEIKTIEQNLLMLGKLEEFTAATTKSSTEKGNLNGEAAISFLDTLWRPAANAPGS